MEWVGMIKNGEQDAKEHENENKTGSDTESERESQKLYPIANSNAAKRLASYV